MNNKGVISISLVLTIMMLVSAIILLIISRHENNRILTSHIINSSRTVLAEAKNPNCYWGNSPYMNSSAQSLILLTCTHIDEIETDLINELTTLTVSDYITVLDSELNPNNNIDVQVNKVVNTSYGYKIYLNLESTTAAKYFLKLNNNQICTKDNYCNKELISKEIIVIN